MKLRNIVKSKIMMTEKQKNILLDLITNEQENRNISEKRHEELGAIYWEVVRIGTSDEQLTIKN